MPITITLNSPEEAQVLTNILNIAVKAVGLDAAEAGVVFAKRIAEAVKAAEKAPRPNGKGEDNVEAEVVN